MTREQLHNLMHPKLSISDDGLSISFRAFQTLTESSLIRAWRIAKRHHALMSLSRIFKHGAETLQSVVRHGGGEDAATVLRQIEQGEILANSLDRYNLTIPRLRKIVDLSNPKEIRDHKRKIQPGFVYVFYCETRGHKIGKSKNYKERLKVFQEYPFNAKTILARLVPDYTGTEKLIHKQFAAQRISGEWFRLTDSDVQEIDSILKSIQLPEAMTA